jgi:arsenical pump membrane protein
LIVAVARIVALVLASGFAMFPWKRMPGWIGPAAVAVVALGVGLVPWSAARTATHDLYGAVLFLLLAVPVAVLLDETGFFAALAAGIDGGPRLRVGLWVLAAFVVIVFNLDAAVVLLTPLYVRIAERRGDDPVMFGFMPAVLASLASSVLPVSNLTNLIATERLGLGAGDFAVHLALPSLVSVVVGGWVFLRSLPPEPGVAVVDEPVDRAALLDGFPVVAFLLVGFTAGERVGIPAWCVAAIALVGLAAHRRSVPWRHVPAGAALLAAGLGVLAAAAAVHLPVERILAIDGAPGELATVGVVAAGSNAVNNLPALLLTLPGLDEHRDRVWAVLLGANLGPTLWVTGALSTLLWQASMRRLGHRVDARTYCRVAARAGLPALLAAVAVHLVVR